MSAEYVEHKETIAVLDSVHEYAEKMPVEIAMLSNGRLAIQAKNEGGFNCTWVDLEELVIALNKIEPTLRKYIK